MWDNIGIKNQKVKKIKAATWSRGQGGPRRQEFSRRYDYKSLESISSCEG